MKSGFKKHVLFAGVLTSFLLFGTMAVSHAQSEGECGSVVSNKAASIGSGAHTEKVLF